MTTHVRERAENRPGVYRFMGAQGEVLYVGKSVRVRTRLLSYFRAAEDDKATDIVERANHVEWDYTPSEFAALLTEFRLIKRWRPPFNVQHKRDTGFCFVKLTREAVPRLTVVSSVHDDGGEYFGPLRGRTRVTEAVHALVDLTLLRDCASDTKMRLGDQLELLASTTDPRCIRGQTGRCLSPCARGCTQAEYLAQLAVARAFLEGVTEQPLVKLREKIGLAGAKLQFEYAAQLRDRMENLARLQDDLVGLGRLIHDFSFVYTARGFRAEDRVYVVRRGTVRADLPAPRTPEEHAALQDVITTVFSRPEPHRIGLGGHEAQESGLVARWFRLHPEELDRTRRIDPVTTQLAADARG